MEASKKRTLQPSKILESVGVKVTDDNVKIIPTTLSLLNYLNIGDTLAVGHSSYTKISDELIQISSKIKGKDIVDSLEENEIINIPA